MAVRDFAGVPAICQNPKSESRNPKQIRMTKTLKFQTAELGGFSKARKTSACGFRWVWSLRIWDFEFVSDFGFRASDFIRKRAELRTAI